MNIKVCAVALAAVAFASPAYANNISGPRVEVLAGWDNVGIDNSGIDGSRGGVAFGLGVGYDMAIGDQWAIGIDAEIADSTTDLEASDGADSAKVSTGRDLYIGGRFTIPASEKFNVYVKAGYTNARIKVRATVDGDTFKDAANGDGVRAGIGVQAFLGGSTYVGAEYRYSNYEGGFDRNQVVATAGIRF